mgnify:CR=1 FL=1
MELAIVARSNVGKSSLLNALANRTKLAKTSKTPGATRLINIFELTTGEPGRWLVDLPGYGYAKVSHTERNKWAAMIERYLDERETLDTILWLIDGEIGPTKLDLQTWEWLVDKGLPIKVIATKAYQTTVTMTETGSEPFTLVAEDLVYPAPPGAVGDTYVFYIGFDPQALKPEKPAPRKKK